jgi:hypothetical protein
MDRSPLFRRALERSLFVAVLFGPLGCNYVALPFGLGAPQSGGFLLFPALFR